MEETGLDRTAAQCCRRQTPHGWDEYGLRHETPCVVGYGIGRADYFTLGTVHTELKNGVLKAMEARGTVMFVEWDLRDLLSVRD